MKVIENITFPLVSNDELLVKMGLENPNMNRAPVTVVLGKNMTKYWVHEGINVTDRPNIEEILNNVERVGKMYE